MDLNTVYVKRTIDLAIDKLTMLGMYAVTPYFTLNRSANLPYHNKFHATCMVLNCIEAYDHYASIDEPVELQALLIASVFHDYDHSGGKLPDHMNIHNAITGLSHFFNTDYATSDYQALRSDVRALIRVTEFPFVRDAKTLGQQIIRDADLLAICEDNWYDVLFNGLRREIEVLSGKSISICEFADMQLNFMENVVVLHTDWAKEKYKAILPQRYEELHKLKCQKG